jgi:hypothetical protein
MPFRHPDRAHDLTTRIEHEVRERLESAIDDVCLQALVAGRRARGLPPPAADSAEDRRAYEAHVGAFLALLTAELAPGGEGDPAPLDRQVRLARALPDYWQRFERVGTRYLEASATSGGERRGLLAWLFGRG